MARDDAVHRDGGRGSEESTGTVLLAGAANLVIAVAKLAGGLVSGSAAMLAEAAHSVADTLNQVFLLAALRRSRRPADEEHPFGYAQERYFWALLAAVGIFVLGAGFSMLEGARAILSTESETGGYLVAYIVLAVAFVAEGSSWLKAARQVRREARGAGREVLQHVRATPDPTVKTVAFEDTAALVGIVLAALGLGLHQLTGSAVWDGVASIAIGVLLIVVAYYLGRDSKHRLVGTAAPPQLRREIDAEISGLHGVARVIELMTMQLGPQDLLVAAKVDLADGLSGEDAERLAGDVEQALVTRFPSVKHVFVDPTSPGERRRREQTQVPHATH